LFDFDLPKRKTGPAPKPLADLRLVVVTVKLTAAEAGELDLKRGFHGRSAWLRSAGLDRVLTSPLPKNWQTTWDSSARMASVCTQLNSLAAAANGLALAESEAAAAKFLLADLKETRALLAEFRAGLSDSVSQKI
jgi:hypothetical protein